MGKHMHSADFKNYEILRDMGLLNRDTEYNKRGTSKYFVYTLNDEGASIAKDLLEQRKKSS